MNPYTPVNKDTLINIISTFKITTKDGKELFFDNFHPEQEKVFDIISRGETCVFLKPRQIGISTAVGAMLLAILLTTPDPITIGIITHKLALSKKLLLIVSGMYNSLPKAIQDKFPTRITASEIEMINTRAKMVAVGAGDHGGVRGYTFTIGWLSELAFFERADEVLAGALASINDGQIIIESTANHFNDILYQKINDIQSGRLSWKFEMFPWNIHPTYKKAPPDGFELTEEEEKKGLSIEQACWYREQQAKFGHSKARREYPLSIDEAYSSAEDAFIEDDYLKKLNILDTKMNESYSNGKIFYHEQPGTGTRYVIGCDPSFGLGQDFSCIHVLDARTLTVVATARCNKWRTTHLSKIIMDLSVKYGAGSPSGKAIVNLEVNSIGRAVYDDLLKRGIPILHINGEPWTTTSATKPVLLETIRSSIVNGSLKNIDDFTYNEVKVVRIDERGKLDIPTRLGSHADGIISLSLALIAAKQVPIPKTQHPMKIFKSKQINRILARKN